MNQAGCACAYVYDCCKLLQVFSAPVYPDRRRRLSTLSSISSILHTHTHTHIYIYLFLPSFFLFHLLVPALVPRFFFCAVPQRQHPPALEGCTSSSGSSNVLFILFIESTRHSAKLYSTSQISTRVFFRSFMRCYARGVHRGLHQRRR